MGPWIRIALRYLSGFLIAKGMADPSFDLSLDPDITAAVEAGVGVVIGAATEAYYVMARRLGWSK